MRLSASLLTAWLALALAACGHSHGDCEGHSHDPACLQCEGDEDAYDAVRTGEMGNLTIELLSAEPNPHLGDNYNSLRIRVLDSEGDPVDGVTFDEIEPFTVQAGHGTPVKPVATPAGEPGEYDITDLAYVHEGIWEVRFSLSAGAVSDRIVFTFCVVAG
jgi:hypothetical protein